MTSRSAIYTDLQQLLVKPADQISFIVKFFVLTAIGDLMIIYLANKTVAAIYMKEDLLTRTIIGLIVGCVIGIFWGAIAGILQYALLKKYLIREWIIATVINSVAYSVYSILILLWSVHVSEYPIDPAELDLHPIWFWLEQNYFLFLLIIVGLIYGAIQWLIFQSYIKQVNWWLIFPLATIFISGFEYLPIALVIWFFFKRHLTDIKHLFYYLLAVKVISSVVYNLAYQQLMSGNGNLLLNKLATPISSTQYLLVYGGSDNIYSFWFSWVSSLLTFITIQAIAICYLRKQEQDENPYVEKISAFVSTLDLNNPTQIRSVIKKLNDRINTVWQEELNCRFPLTYWLAVNARGFVVAYHPINQVSADNLSLTPLPQLTGDRLTTEPTAKLQVEFAPPAISNIKSLAGKPLPLLAVGSLTLLAIVSLSGSILLMSYLRFKYANH